MSISARQAAVSALIQIHREGGYSNIVLDNLLNRLRLEDRERGMATALVYGVVERRLTIDYLIDAVSRQPADKLHPIVADILRTGVYQLLWMDRVPEAAAVSEAVNLTRSMKCGHAAGFVNGVLRNVARSHTAILEKIPDGDEGLAIRHSCPVELIRLWRGAYGKTAEGLLAELHTRRPAVIRVNTLKIKVENFISALQEAEIGHISHPRLPGYIILTQNEQQVTELKLAKLEKSWYYHQDSASGYCCLALDARPGERVADLCAAPGGKSLTLAQHMQNRGQILAGDIHPGKCDLLSKRAAELGAAIVQTVCRDAAADCPKPLKGAFDRVLCDVPCSGLGVIRRKPEIRYKPLESFVELPALQYRILEQSAKMVRPGGVLQYSTCTLNPAENEDIARRFLENHPEFTPRPLGLEFLENPLGEPAWYRTLFPHLHDTDGFFIAGFRRL